MLRNDQIRWDAKFQIHYVQKGLKNLILLIILLQILHVISEAKVAVAKVLDPREANLGREEEEKGPMKRQEVGRKEPPPMPESQVQRP